MQGQSAPSLDLYDQHRCHCRFSFPLHEPWASSCPCIPFGFPPTPLPSLVLAVVLVYSGSAAIAPLSRTSTSDEVCLRRMAWSQSTRVTLGAVLGSLVGFYVADRLEDEYKVRRSRRWQEGPVGVGTNRTERTNTHLFDRISAGETQGEVQRGSAEREREEESRDPMKRDVPRSAEGTDVFEPPWGPLGRDFVLGTVSGFGKLWLQVLNTFTVTNHETLLRCALERKKGDGLITVSNHASTLDDPFVISALLPWEVFYRENQHQKVRWSMCAKSVCFKNKILEDFFRNGKVMPIGRGEGFDQPIVARMAERLVLGDWVHVFPEGKVVPHGGVDRLKWGTAKLLCECKAAGKVPKVLPFYHHGMADVMGIGNWFPRVGKRVHVVVGEPLDMSDLATRCNQEGENQAVLFSQIMQRIEENLKKLELQAKAGVGEGFAGGKTNTA